MNKFKLTAGAGLAALALAFAGGGYYHYHVRTDTPGFAIEQVGQALEKHNLQEFHRAVDVDGVINSGYEGFIEGLTAVDSTATPEVKDAIKNFSEMFRVQMMASVKAALDSYVASGEFKSEKNAGVSEILEITGLKGIEIRDVKNLQLSDVDKSEAFADVIVFQPELEREFPIQVVLTRDNDEHWKITRMQNFREYVEQINFARRSQLDDYIAKTSEINSAHEIKLREAEQNYGTILLRGSLGIDETRAELRTMLLDVFKADWQARKDEFNSLHVPREAQALQNIYINICDLSIAAAQDYANWMDDKNPVTIKAAEEKIHQVQALMTDAAALSKELSNINTNEPEAPKNQ